jgi:hypothetical protein
VNHGYEFVEHPIDIKALAGDHDGAGGCIHRGFALYDGHDERAYHQRVFYGRLQRQMAFVRVSGAGGPVLLVYTVLFAETFKNGY